MKMFNVVQMPEVNSRMFRVIKGQVSPSGHTVGSFQLIADNLEIGVARAIKTELCHAEHAGAVSLQVLPCFEEEGDLIPQEFGPDVQTEFWCVYERYANGATALIDDFATAQDAYDRAEILAKGLGIEVEAPEWADAE
jgi:hypothetical protein